MIAISSRIGEKIQILCQCLGSRTVVILSMDSSIVSCFTEKLKALKHSVKVVEEIKGHKTGSFQQVVVVPNVHLEKLGMHALDKFKRMPCVVVKESWITDMLDGCGSSIGCIV